MINEFNLQQQAFYQLKLTCETDCSDVYHEMQQAREQNKPCSFVLLDVRSEQAFGKSHALGAINLPHGEISQQKMLDFSAETEFVVYCWGPGCNGATKAALKLAHLGFKVKEMIGGIHYWEDFERYPVVRKNIEVQA